MVRSYYPYLCEVIKLISLCELNNCGKRQFRCNTQDVLDNKHIPVDGQMLGYILRNGDELYIISGAKIGATYIYDLDANAWVEQ